MTKAMAHIILRLAKQIKKWNIASGHHVVDKSGNFIRGRYRQIPWEIQKKKDQLTVIGHNRYNLRDQGDVAASAGSVWKINGKRTVMPEYKPMSEILIEKARKTMKNKYAHKNMNMKDMKFWAREERKELDWQNRKKAITEMIRMKGNNWGQS
tara:strand:+ start:8568 stop:9026 length:459 start_codon:yes stop_codon:yes gene_type:complete